MNRKLQLLLISIILVATNVSSQKYDFNWLIGYSSIPKKKDSVEGHTMLNFNTKSGQLEFKFDKNKILNSSEVMPCHFRIRMVII